VVIPGAGQAYNGQYWKLPLVYGALAIPTSTFIYNNTWYKKTRDAYQIVINEDTARYDEIDPKLQGLDAQSLQYYRNDFRRNRDISVLFILLTWGLNVVDATVSMYAAVVVRLWRVPYQSTTYEPFPWQLYKRS
jgi:phage FluMu gp28-like protein